MTMKRFSALFTALASLTLATWAGVALKDGGAAYAQPIDDNSGLTEDANTPNSNAAGAPSTDYYPCPAGQDIDILVMTDASGSLNQSGGVDPAGTYRRAALEALRSIFVGQSGSRDPSIEDQAIRDIIGTDPDAAEDTASALEVRLALFYFHNEAAAVTGFRPLDDNHPSEADIKTTLQLGQVKGRNTNYEAALEKVIEAFAQTEQDGSGEDKCRVLLFFTDGIYDPDGSVGVSSGPTESKTVDLTNRLRQSVCVGDPDTGSSSIASRFRALGIQTFAVLLGESFVEALNATDGNDRTRRIATASLQALRGLTSDSTTQFDDQVEEHPDCAVQKNEQHGQIITLREISDLEITLVEVVETAVSESTLLRWPLCNSEQPEPETRKSAILPAGRFIGTIAVYPSGGTISEYRIQGIDGSDWQTPDTQTRLILNQDPDLAGLQAGWALEVKLTPNSGYTADEMTLTCYVTPTEKQFTPLQFEVQDDLGETAERIYVTPDDHDGETPDYTSSYKLIAMQEDGEQPEICRFQFQSARIYDPFSNQPLELDFSQCTLGGFPQIPEYQAICGDLFRVGQNMDVTLIPAYIHNIFEGDETEFVVPAAMTHESQVECPLAPMLYACSDQLNITNDDDEVPKEPLRGEMICTLRSPTAGRITIQADWQLSPSASIPGPFNWQLSEVRIGDAVSLTPNEPVALYRGATTAALNAQLGEVTIHSTMTEQLAFSNSLTASNLLLLHMAYVTEEALDDMQKWDIKGQFSLQSTWQPDIPLYADRKPVRLPYNKIPVSASFLARSIASSTLIITFGMLAASLMSSYLILCWVLRGHLTLPDPRDFWAYYVPLDISRDPDNERLSVAAPDPDGIPLTTPILLRVAEQKGRCFISVSVKSQTGDRLLISMKRAAFLNLPRLLRDVQATISSSSRFAAANSKGSQPSTVQIAFKQLTVVELQPDRSGSTVRGAAWFLEPRKGSEAGRTHAPLSEVQDIVDALAIEMANSQDPEAPEEESAEDEEHITDTPVQKDPLKSTNFQKRVALPSAQAPLDHSQPPDFSSRPPSFKPPIPPKRRPGSTGGPGSTRRPPKPGTPQQHKP